MDFKTILIIALVIFAWYSYNNPTDSKALIDNGIEKTQSFIGTAKSNLVDNDCPAGNDPVCADGVTFINPCKAQEAGYQDMIAGVC